MQTITGLLAVVCSCRLLVAGPSGSQPVAKAFEVASIRPLAPVTPAMLLSGKLYTGMGLHGSLLTIRMYSLKDLICSAYEVKPTQVSGPGWLDTQRFDIQARLPKGSTWEQVPQMLRNLLADRFKLAVHRYVKEQRAYALVVAKEGFKARKSVPAPASTSGDAGGPSQVVVNKSSAGYSVSGDESMGLKGFVSSDDWSLEIERARMNMGELADCLSGFLDRAVVDKTGVQGDYQVRIKLSIEELQRIAKAPGSRTGDSAYDPSGDSLGRSLRLLGLKLDACKTTTESLVVDHAERIPTPN